MAGGAAQAARSGSRRATSWCADGSTAPNRQGDRFGTADGRVSLADACKDRSQLPDTRHVRALAGCRSLLDGRADALWLPSSDNQSPRHACGRVVREVAGVHAADRLTFPWVARSAVAGWPCARSELQSPERSEKVLSLRERSKGTAMTVLNGSL